MSKKGVTIKINDIKINKENFRHSPLNNEIAAIHYLISEDYDSYLNLAKEMQKDCRTFTALMLQKNDELILMDANRRVSVIKVFDNPSLIPVGNKYDDLRNLCIANGTLNIDSILADIYFDSDLEDKENLMNALNELHIKDNKTKKDWNALSQYRASKFIGSTIKHPWIKTLEYYKYSDQDIIAMTNQRTDIFARIMRVDALNIQNDGKIGLNNDKVILKEICKIVKDRAYYIYDKVQKIDTRTLQSIYKEVVDDLIQKYSIGQIEMFSNEETDSNNISTLPINLEKKDIIPSELNIETESNLNQIQQTKLRLGIDEKNQDDFIQNEITKNEKPLKPINFRRNTIISVDQRNELSSTPNDQVNQIAYELSTLNLNTYIISAPIIMRSFLQYSFEWYAKNNGISYSHNNLTGTINSVMNKLFEKKLITRENKDSLKILLNNAELINLLNDVTHNFDSQFISKVVLTDFYDSIHPLIKNIYK